MKKRVAVGLSGGVDSSLSAALLVEQGLDVTGVYITCWDGPGCRSEEDRQDALDVALQLKIPFVHLDFQQEYKEKVYEYMMREYEAGRTPNPDVMCNKEIKFGLFYDWALRQVQGKPAKFDFVATGHYAQIKKSPKSEVRSHKSIDSRLKTQHLSLFRGVDEHKDQTYFLYQLRQEQLAHILFPIGGLTKKQVRAEAQKRKLLTAKKPDSQGICFIGEQPMKVFLEKRIKPKLGDIFLMGKIVGKHQGVQFYTIGQKIGLDNAKLEGFDNTQLPHFYVMKKNMEKNVLEVGVKDQLYTDEIEVGEPHWIGDSPQDQNLQVRIRHGGELVGISNIKYQKTNMRIKLEKSVWGVAPGQSVVIYEGEVVLGGGVIRC